MNKQNPAQQLASMRRTKDVICPVDQGGCGEERTTLMRSKPLCRKCRDKIRKRLVALGKDSIK